MSDPVEREIALYRELVDKNERHFEDFKVEILKVTDRYLESLNCVLEKQSEFRNKVTSLEGNLAENREKLILVKDFVERLDEMETLQQLISIKEFLKKADDMNLFDAIVSMKQKIRTHQIAIYAFAATLLAFLSTILSNFING